MKKIYSFVLLAVTLLLSTNIWAANVAKVTNTADGTLVGEYETMADALAVWTDGTTLTMLDDATCDATDSYSVTGSRILNFDNKKLTWNFTYQEEGATNAIEIIGNVTLQGGEFVGTVSAPAGKIISFIAVKSNAYFVTTNMQFVSNYKATNRGYFLNSCPDAIKSNHISLQETKFTMSGGCNRAVYIQYSSRLEKCQDVTIEAKNITTIKEIDGIYIGRNIVDDLSTKLVNTIVDLSGVDDAVVTVPVVWSAAPTVEQTLTIESGIFTCNSNANSSVVKLWQKGNFLQINGGKYSKEPTSKFTDDKRSLLIIPEGKAFAKVGEYYELVSKGVAGLANSTPYTTFEELWAACPDGVQTSVVLLNEGKTDVITIPAGKNILLSIGVPTQEYNITNNGTITLNSTMLGTITSSTTGKLSVIGGTFAEKEYNAFVKDNVADGYTAYLTAKNAASYKVWKNSNVMAVIDNVAYAKLQDALFASSATAQAKVMNDCYLPLSTSELTISDGKEHVIDLNGHRVTLSPGLVIDNAKLTFNGTGTLTASSSQPIELRGSATATNSNYSVLTIGEDISLEASGCNYMVNIIDANKLYGIVVNMNGKMNLSGKTEGFYVNGSVKPACDGNVPVFNINGTINTDKLAIYAAGYAEWNIRGTINAGTGVAIKAGKLNVYDGATIATNGEAQRVVGWGNGVNESGAAIQIESNNGYSACGVDVNIEGGNISSKNGYSIYEYLDSNSKTTDTHVNTIAVGGKVKVDGPISISQDMASTIGGFINGGTYTSDINAYVKDGFITKANSDGTYGVTAEEATVINNTAWASQTTDAANAKVQGTVETSNNVAAKRVIVEADATLTIKAGTTLTIGVGGLHLQNATTSKVVVEAGATLLVDGLIFNATADNLLIKSSEAQPGRLLISPTTEMYGEDHPSATMEFVSKSYLSGSKLVWQRFGIPSNTAIETMTCADASVTTYIYDFDYAKNTWNQLGKLGEFDVKQMNRPFACYDMACNAAQAGTQYQIVAELVGNGDVELPAVSGWNYFANSYTGDINIEAMLDELIGNGGTIDGTVYVYKKTGTDTYTWETVDKMTVGDGDVQSSIAPMQAYIVRNTATTTTTPLKYNEMVWKPATAVKQNKVAARQNTVSDMTKVCIKVSNAAGNYDNVVVGESAQFSADYDKGYDAVKYMNEDINIYVMADEKQSTFATDDLNKTYLGFSCVNGGTYTISFSSVKGEELYLTDLFTNTTVQMAEGITYEFNAAANTTNDRRFVISKRQGVVTGIDNIVAPQATGIYNLMGQYIGEMSEWNNLPSGIYIVNGQKQVK